MISYREELPALCSAATVMRRPNDTLRFAVIAPFHVVVWCIDDEDAVVVSRSCEPVNGPPPSDRNRKLFYSNPPSKREISLAEIV